jgi:hypothetical protein
MNRDSIPGMVNLFRVQVQSVQIETGAIQLLIPSAKRVFYPRSKRPKRKADTSYSTEVKQLVELHLNYGVRRDNFTFLDSAARVGSV